MADRAFNLHFRTTADVAGIRTTTAEMQNLAGAQRELTTGADLILEKTRQNVQVNHQMTQGHLQQSRAAGNAGMAMLQLAQFTDDVQYGMRGVVNNIPGMVASLGGGMGLAGAVGIAAVAISQLLPMLTSLGDKAAKFQPPKLTLEDEDVARWKRYREEIEAQVEAFDRLAQVQKRVNDETKIRLDHEREADKLLHKPTAGEDANVDVDAEQAQLDHRTRARIAEVQSARELQARREAEFRAAEEDFKKQQQRLEGLKQADSILRELANNQGLLDARKRGLQAARASEGAGYSSREEYERKLAEMEADVARREARQKELQDRMQGLPVRMPDEDPKAQEQAAEAARKRMTGAGQAADSAGAAAAAADLSARVAQQRDEWETQQRINQALGRPAPPPPPGMIGEPPPLVDPLLPRPPAPLPGMGAAAWGAGGVPMHPSMAPVAGATRDPGAAPVSPQVSDAERQTIDALDKAASNQATDPIFQQQITHLMRKLEDGVSKDEAGQLQEVIDRLIQTQDQGLMKLATALQNAVQTIAQKFASLDAAIAQANQSVDALKPQ